MDLLALGMDADAFGDLISLVPGLDRLDSGKEVMLICCQIAKAVKLSAIGSRTPFYDSKP